MFAMASGGRAGASAHTVNVAIVDDDGSVRSAFARLVLAAGFNPVAYSSAEGFLADPRRAQTDCLVLDVRLGGMSGLDLQERLTAGGVAPPIIFVTAHEEPDAQERARRAGCVAFFHKPVPGRALLEAVRQAVDSSPRPAGSGR
jgi:FixJ family two-component response regulator